MALTDIDNHHFSAMTKLAFTPAGGRSPEWLQAQFEQCVSHYGNVLITPQFQAALSRFQNQSEQPFEVFVIGEGKFGKSTLVNALVGQDISAVKTGIPETRTFLRFVLKSNPADEAIVYAQLRPGMHDLIRERLGPGEACDEIYATRRFLLGRDLAGELLKMDIAACREHGRNYTPAILEMERQLLWTPNSLFPEGVRLVDTQGLSQIFDDDLLKRCENMDLYNSEVEFDNWMANSRRGRHLDWQFRRCDAVLWLISAQKPNSGATRAALRYLNKYGKRTIIAVTQIDRVQGGPGQVERILNEVQRHFSQFGSEIIPVNGKLAMVSSLSGNQESIASSGLASLVARLRTVCTEDAGRVRAVSQYISLKTTEAQMRTAIGTMTGEIDAILSGLADLRQLVATTRQAEMDRVSRALSRTGAAQLSALRSRVASIGLMDNTDSALQILQPAVSCLNFENSARSACILLDAEFENLAATMKATPFSLPSFDAEGRAAGATVSAAFNVKMEAIEIPSLSLSFSLSMRPVKAAWIGAKKWLPWTRDGAEDEERRLNSERQAGIVTEVEQRWSELQSGAISRLTDKANKTFNRLSKELDRVESEIEKVDGRPLPETATRLKKILSAGCVQSPYLVTMVTTLRIAAARHRNGRV